MILTGKAKEDFEIWLNKEMYYLGRHNFDYRDNNIEDLSLNFQNALIIEWFDSIGNFNHNGAVYNFKTLYLSTFKQLEKHHSILDIQKIAIKKANEIYNETTGK